MHRVSFVADDGAQRTRIIKKIFVTRTEYDQTTEEFIIVAPEGRLSVLLKGGLGPKGGDKCTPSSKPNPISVSRTSLPISAGTAARFQKAPTSAFRSTYLQTLI